MSLETNGNTNSAQPSTKDSDEDETGKEPYDSFDNEEFDFAEEQFEEEDQVDVDARSKGGINEVRSSQLLRNFMSCALTMHTRAH